MVASDGDDGAGLPRFRAGVRGWLSRRAGRCGAQAVTARNEKMKLSHEVKCATRREREVACCYKNFKNVGYPCTFVG
jgi:hypothetical protein